MNTVGLTFKQKVAVLIGMISGSILITSVVLSSTVAFMAFGFLMSGTPFPQDTMVSIWMVGLVLWIMGLIPITKWVGVSTYVCGGIVFFITLFIVMIEVNPYNLTVAIPLIFAIISGGTFLDYATNFVGIHKDDSEKE